MQKFRLAFGFVLGIAIFFLSCLLLVLPAQATDFPGTSQFLIDQGKQHYQKGDLASALHEFSKAILVDPGNAAAKDYLGKMGFTDGMYGHRPSPLARSAALAQEVKVFKDKWADAEKTNEMTAVKLRQTQEERDTLCLSLEEKKSELHQMNDELIMAQKNFQQDNLAARQRTRDLQARAALREEEIAFLERFTDKHKKLVNEKEDALSKKDREIQELNERMQLAKLASLDDAFNSQDQLLRQRSEYQTAVLDLNARIKHLQKEYAATQDRHLKTVSNLQAAISAKENELVKTKNQLTEMQLAYVPKISEPPEESAAVESAAVVLDQKIALLKQRDKDIAQLKERLVEARRQIAALQKSPQPGHEPEIASLKKQVEHMRAQLKQRADSLENEQGDFVILKERLQDAQEQLGIVKTMVREKETEIKELQDQISQVRSQCK